MNTRLRLATLAAVLTLLTPVLRAKVPKLINYQGRVAVGTVNFDGSGLFKFALVNADGTETHWSNDGTSGGGSEPATAVTLSVTKGLYSVLLGDTTLTHMTALTPDLFDDTDVRLRVWFNDGAHGFQLFTPDQRIAAVGYAMIAAGVQDHAITSEKLADGAVQSAHIAAGAVGSNQLGIDLNLNGHLTVGDGRIILPTPNGNRSIIANTDGISIDGISIGANTGITLPSPIGNLAITADNEGLHCDGIGISAANGIVFPNLTGFIALNSTDTGAKFDIHGGDFVVANASGGVRIETSGAGVTVDDKQAMVASERLHMIRGAVNADGTVAQGTGFSVSLIPPGSGGTPILPIVNYFSSTVPLNSGSNSFTITNDARAHFPVGLWLKLGTGFHRISDSYLFSSEGGGVFTAVVINPPFSGPNGDYAPIRGMSLYPSYTVTFPVNTFGGGPVVTLGGAGGLPSQGDPKTESYQHTEVYLDNAKPRTTNSFSVITSPGVLVNPAPNFLSGFEFIAVGARP